MTTANRHVLYISYNGMLQPLGQSQVIPYLKGLAAAGYDFTLLSFERDEAYSDAGRELCARLKQELAQANIDWHWRLLTMSGPASDLVNAWPARVHLRWCTRAAIFLRPWRFSSKNTRTRK